jgi:hypothetical protein
MHQCRRVARRRRVARPFAGDRKSFAPPAADGYNHDSSQRSSGHAISHLSAIGLAQDISIRASAGTNNSTTSYRSTQATPAGFRTGLCRIRGQDLTCQIRLLTAQSGLSQIHPPSPSSLDTPNERASARHLKISQQSSAPGSLAHKLPISERSRTARRAKSAPPCRRRRARVLRTTTGAAQAGADSDRVASMIPAFRP